MRIIYASQIVDGKVVRKPIILEDRICTVCGDSFSPKRQNSKECSTKCQKKAENKRNRQAYNERAKEYYKNNLESIRVKRKAYYHKDPEKWRSKTKEWNENNREKKREMDKSYKDKTRHGGKREELISQNGLVCSMCGKSGYRFEITAHHSSFDKTNHDFQELLCRSCHAKTHAPLRNRDGNGQKFIG